jgi:hypothetical protein
LSALLLIAGSAQAQGRKPIEERQFYEMKKSDGPLSWRLEEFMALVSTVYGNGDHDAEFYREFCHLYSIDSSWPSAQRMGTVFRELTVEYGSRIGQARLNSAYRDHDGYDPNEWRTEAMGKAFVEIYEDLRRDGLPFSFDRFIEVIKIRIPGNQTVASTEPLTKSSLKQEEELFWKGAAARSAEAAAYHQKGIQR